MTRPTSSSPEAEAWAEKPRPRGRFSGAYGLVFGGILSWLCYLAIAGGAQSLHVGGPNGNTLLGLLALFGVAFSLSLISLRLALRLPDDHRLLVVLWCGAIAFRVTLLPCDPIQEIDLYRYVWDGAVSNCGISPFRYAPQQVLAASANEPLPADLADLVRLRDSSPELNAVLSRIHFGELPTIYPPVSQVIFAGCSWMTPSHSSVGLRLMLMKGWFTVFDLLTLALVIRLLRLTSRHRGWALAYGWCPLVVKEIANSGHLDALATFLTTLALLWTLRVLQKPDSPRRCLRFAIAAALALALAVGAKLYPVVLAPLLFWTQTSRTGWKIGLPASATFALASFALLWPMFPTTIAGSTGLDQSAIILRSKNFPPVPPAETSTAARDPSESLQAFLSRWEMNDFVFLLVIENLRPTADLPPDQIAWFVVTPEVWRAAVVSFVANHTSVPAQSVPFIVTRALLSIVFVVVACGLAQWTCARRSCRDTRGPEVRLLEAAFLTLVWFWLLLPTQNPWYLTWCLPLLPFARHRAWLALSGVAFGYYIRFWLTDQFATPLLGTPYAGARFFDYIVTWLEFGPWFLWLLCGRTSVTHQAE